MTFRTVERVRRNGAPSAAWAERRKRICHFASHKKGDGRVMVIWIGQYWASQIGMIEHRYAVDFMLDADFPNVRRCAIRVNPYSEFRCARHGANHGVHINSDTYAALFGDDWYWQDLGEDAVRIEGDMVILDFPMPMNIDRQTSNAARHAAQLRSFRDDF